MTNNLISKRSRSPWKNNYVGRKNTCIIQSFWSVPGPCEIFDAKQVSRSVNINKEFKMISAQHSSNNGKN